MIRKKAVICWLLAGMMILSSCRYAGGESGVEGPSAPSFGVSSASSGGSSAGSSGQSSGSSSGASSGVSSGEDGSSGGDSSLQSVGSSSSGSSAAPSSKAQASAAPPDSSSKKPNGGGTPSKAPVSQKPVDPTPDPPSFSWDPGGNYTGAISVKEPKASGTVVFQNNGATIDASNTSQGYVMVKKDFTQKTKVRITGPNGQQYVSRYIMTGTGTYDTFPLQMGSGTYKIEVMKNTSGDKYVKAAEGTVNVALSSSTVCYLYPNLFVNYNSSSAAVRKSFGLCMNAKSDLDKVKSIYNYIIRSVSYDYAKAASVPASYKPNPDETLATGKGICFDYAALMACMLRAQGIPTKVVVGSATGTPAHAWNQVYINGKGWITLGIQSYGGWKLMDATFGTVQSKESFIENNANYTAKELY
jgi:hypothetical protein